jgi:2'-5' RNA ligase
VTVLRFVSKPWRLRWQAWSGGCAAKQVAAEKSTGRLFFALVPGQGVIDRLEAFQCAVPVPARQVAPRLFHATLVFLGQRPRERNHELLQVAESVSFEPCEVVLDRPGQFRRSRVGWLGANRVPRALGVFQQALASALDQAGIAFDQRAWTFHVTLYRDLRKPLPIMPPVAINWPLEGFSLLESVQQKDGVDYRQIGHWPR